MTTKEQILQSKWRIEKNTGDDINHTVEIRTVKKIEQVYTVMGEEQSRKVPISLTWGIDKDIAKHIVEIHNDRIEQAKYIKP